MENKQGMDIVGCREILLDEVQKLRTGKSTPPVLNAIINAMGKIFMSAKLEMEYQKALGLKPSIAFIKLISTSNKQLPGKTEQKKKKA